MAPWYGAQPVLDPRRSDGDISGMMTRGRFVIRMVNNLVATL